MNNEDLGGCIGLRGGCIGLRLLMTLIDFFFKIMTFIEFDRFLKTSIDFYRVCKYMDDFQRLLFLNAFIDFDRIW